MKVMKKIGELSVTAILAVLVIWGIDFYTDHRMQEANQSYVAENTIGEETTAEIVPEETTPEETTPEETTADPNILYPVEYVDASATVSQTFSQELAAESAILISVNDKSIIYEKNAQEQLSPASTTKLMTALTVLQHLNPETMITVGEEIYLIGEGSSTANLEVGDTLSVRQLLSGLLISSGNDAAYTLAVNVGRQELDEVVTYEEAIAYFVACMNENVETMGLTNTHFNSPDGYDADNQYISAEDLAMIAYEAYENEEIRTICSTHSLYVKEKDITWTSTNQLMNPDSQYYYDKAIGMKTGSTGNAGKCLVSVAQSGEQVYLCVVLNSDDSGRWLDSIALLDYGFGL
jgi:D-alanyl-D-alanine carboxypeptidase (penicillin-binding protein 5/6)